MEQTPILDMAVLDELQEIMGDDFTTLVASYERDGRHRIEALREALAAANTEQVRQQAHSFKGSSDNLGALRVTALCVSLNQYAQGNELRHAEEALPALADEFRQACDALARLATR